MTISNLLSKDAQCHLVIAAYGLWGHVRPLCVLATRIAKMRRDLDITLLTSQRTYDKVGEEISRNIEGLDEQGFTRAHIRIVGLAAHENDVLDYSVIGEAFQEQFCHMLRYEPVFCASTQQQLPALGSPTALLVGLFGYRFLQISRALSKSVQVFVVLAASMLSLQVLVGPFDANSQGALEQKVHDYMKKTGLSLAEAAEILLLHPSNEVIHPPGFPPMCVYEKFPQERGANPPMLGYIHLTVATLTHECDGMIICSMPSIEPPEVVHLLSSFFALTSRGLHIIGPMVPLSQAQTKQSRPAGFATLATFMQKVLQERGERSLLYISFGTVFWPTKAEKVWTFLDILISRDIPFIMAQASSLACLPEEMAAKVAASGIGLITRWAPQQTILEHPVTGWFVTHGGFNSVTESIHAGIPMICWPFAVDQPLNAMQLTENLSVAYELLEVRTGPSGLKPAYRTGKSPTGTLDALRIEVHEVLDKAFGNDGAEKRANMQVFREASLRTWDEHGAGWSAIEQLLRSLGI